MQVTYHIFSYRFLKGAWRAKHIVRETDYSPILRVRRRKGSEKKSQREGDWSCSLSLQEDLTVEQAFNITISSLKGL